MERENELDYCEEIGRSLDGGSVEIWDESENENHLKESVKEKGVRRDV